MAAQAARAALSKGRYLEAIPIFRDQLGKRDISRVEWITCLLNIGACLIASSQYDEGCDTLKTVINSIEGLPKEEYDPKMAADAHYNLAIAARKLNKAETTCNHLKQALHLFVKAGKKEQAGDIYWELAGLHHAASDIDGQINSLQCAQELYSTSGSTIKEASTILQLATLQQSEKGEDCQQLLTSVSKMLSSDNSIQGAQLQLKLGRTYSSLRMYKEALDTFNKALLLVRQDNCAALSADDAVVRLGTEGAILQNIGAVHNEMQLFNESIDYHKMAAVINEKAELHADEVKSLCNLGFAQAQIKDYSSSANTFSVALSKAEKIKDKLLVVQCLEGLGSVYYHMKQFSESQENFEKALTIMSESEDTGLAKERVMEKLSDIVELQSKAKQSTADELNIVTSSNDEITNLRSKSSDVESQPSTGTSVFGLIPQPSTTASSVFTPALHHINTSIQVAVEEGCLALGPKTKDQYIVQNGEIQEITQSTQRPRVETHSNSSSVCIIL